MEPMMMRADELVSGMAATFEDFTFIVANTEINQENWVHVVPCRPGIPFDVQRYEQFTVAHIPSWVNVTDAPYYSLTN